MKMRENEKMRKWENEKVMKKCYKLNNTLYVTYYGFLIINYI